MKKLSLSYIIESDPELQKLSPSEIAAIINSDDYDKDYDPQAAYENFVDML